MGKTTLQPNPDPWNHSQLYCCPHTGYLPLISPWYRMMTSTPLGRMAQMDKLRWSNLIIHIHFLSCYQSRARLFAHPLMWHVCCASSNTFLPIDASQTGCSLYKKTWLKCEKRKLKHLGARRGAIQPMWLSNNRLKCCHAFEEEFQRQTPVKSCWA